MIGAVDNLNVEQSYVMITEELSSKGHVTKENFSKPQPVVYTNT